MTSKESLFHVNTNTPPDVKEKIPGGDQIVITTNCLYPNYTSLSKDQERSLDDTDGIRGDAAIALIENAAHADVRIVIAVHEDTSQDFFQAVDHIDNPNCILVKHTENGRAPARRAAFEATSALPNAQIIVYTQAEKFSVVNHLKELLAPFQQQTANIVIAKRNPELGKETYPAYMWESEMHVNRTYDQLMQRAGWMTDSESFDWFFGVFAYRNTPELRTLFLKTYILAGEIYSRTGSRANPEVYSGNHYFPLIEALYKKLRIMSVEIPFRYPNLQKRNETSPEKLDVFIERRRTQAAVYRLEALHFRAFLCNKTDYKPKYPSKIKEIV